MFDALGNPPGLFRAVINVSEVLHNGGDTHAAIALSEQFVPRIRRASVTSPMWLGMIAANLASYYLALGNPDAALAPYAEAWARTPHDGGFWHVCMLSPAAELSLAGGRLDASALLTGFFDRFVEESDDKLQPTEAGQRVRVIEQLGRALAPSELARLRHQGRALSFFEADHLVETAVLARQLDKDGLRR